MATRAIVQPFDVLKIRFQLQEEPIYTRISKLQPGKYTGILQSIRLIFKEEGVTAFWKGHIPAQGLSAVYGLVQFASFEFLTKRFDLLFNMKTQSEVVDFLCGAASGCIATTSAMPLDVIRTRLIAQGEPKIYRGSFHAVTKIWQDEKIYGFFRGLTPSLVQIAPYVGLQFTSYNIMKKLWDNYLQEHESSGSLVSGVFAGIFAKIVIYPLDLIRHRLQVNPSIRHGFGTTSLYQGMFKGLLPSMMKAGLSSGLSFTCYEFILIYSLDIFEGITNTSQLLMPLELNSLSHRVHFDFRDLLVRLKRKGFKQLFFFL
uniref:Mitochondrial thiamine pyrophosphate carrier n=1 Tax=Acrobeloides nanus TaxID=290746 RepID=A0A914ENW5_9BILA